MWAGFLQITFYYFCGNSNILYLLHFLLLLNLLKKEIVHEVYNFCLLFFNNIRLNK